VIVVDTSALVAIVLQQGRWEICHSVLARELEVLMSAGTMTEALIVAGRKGVASDVLGLIEGLQFEIDPVTSAVARRAADAYGRWGKGRHVASLNFGDCFAYELATRKGCPLLFVGNDFSKTDVVSAL